jgi:hypothetical protein
VTGHTAYVFDLDGVVRDFAPGDPSAAIEAALSLPAGHVAATAFHSDLLTPTITGRQTFDDWYSAICAALEDAAAEPGHVRHHMERWRANRGTVIDETVERLETLRSSFKPEFLNRLDEVVVFDALSRDDLAHIVDLQVRAFAARLSDRRVTVEVTDAARLWLAERGYDPAYGARPLRRLVQREIGDRLARGLLSGDVRDGSTVTVGVDEAAEQLTLG